MRMRTSEARVYAQWPMVSEGHPSEGCSRAWPASVRPSDLRVRWGASNILAGGLPLMPVRGQIWSRIHGPEAAALLPGMWVADVAADST